jgi:peptidoglycan/xylan/chitin deacetylase (PgdA/CDA1 family)
MYPRRIPRIIHTLFTGPVWKMPGNGRELYLTFDDGPIPEVTPWVLETLARYNAKATFFCIGRNCAAHPGILERIRREGHAVGNHTWDHPRGRKTSSAAYFRNYLQCQAITRTGLFRPPYGSMTLRQYKVLRRRTQVVLWDVLSGDFDPRIDGPTCLHNVMGHVRPGSIVVFHDSLKAETRLRYALPRALEQLSGQGYRFVPLRQ